MRTASKAERDRLVKYTVSAITSLRSHLVKTLGGGNGAVEQPDPELMMVRPMTTRTPRRYFTVVSPGRLAVLAAHATDVAVASLPPSVPTKLAESASLPTLPPKEASRSRSQTGIPLSMMPRRDATATTVLVSLPELAKSELPKPVGALVGSNRIGGTSHGTSHGTPGMSNSPSGPRIYSRREPTARSMSPGDAGSPEPRAEASKPIGDVKPACSYGPSTSPPSEVVITGAAGRMTSPRIDIIRRAHGDPHARAAAVRGLRMEMTMDMSALGTPSPDSTKGSMKRVDVGIDPLV